MREDIDPGPPVSGSRGAPALRVICGRSWALGLVAAVPLLWACGAEGINPNEPPGPAPPGMVWIPGGTFLMGSEGEHAGPEERPVHKVYVDGFFMDVVPVTNARFEEFVEATGHVTVAERIPDEDEILAQLPPGTPAPPPELLEPGSVVFEPTGHLVDLRDWSQWWRWAPGADWRHPEGPGSTIDGKAEHPVVHVAWPDVVAYGEWAGKRLPTEAEWEFAARGGREGATYVWGDVPLDPEHPQAHIYGEGFPTHRAETMPVGSFAENPYGLQDMSGNVWEWTADWYRPDTYAQDAARGLTMNPTGPPRPPQPQEGLPPMKVLRGGSFLCSDVYCRGYRISARSPGDPASGTSNVGFRTVMTVDQWERMHGTN